VRCLIRSTSSTRRIDDLGVETVVGDLFDRASLDEGMRGCDAAIHLASVSSWDEIASDIVERVIEEGTRAVLAAARASGIGRVVYVSSITAINASREPVVWDEGAPYELAESGLRYSISKHRAEELVGEAVAEGLDVVIVNPAETYGAGDDEWITAGTVRDWLRGWPALALRGGSALVHVDDVAAGILAALDKGTAGERYILGGENLTVADMARRCLREAGMRKPVVVLPERAVRAAVRIAGALRLPPPLPADLVGYACRYWFVDSTKARTELGFSTRPTDETIREVVRWVQEQKSNGAGVREREET
jgi:dihydroflavonol-4-reductase